MDERLAQMMDKQAIIETLYHYARALDRCDADLMRTVFWPDGHDDHGVFKATGKQFCDTVFDEMRRQFAATQHIIANPLVALYPDGQRTRAKSECYFHAWHRIEDDAGNHVRDDFVCGRYLDTHERREAEWRILERHCVMDWSRREPATAKWWDDWKAEMAFSQRGSADPLYARHGWPWGRRG